MLLKLQYFIVFKYLLFIYDLLLHCIWFVIILSNSFIYVTLVICFAWFTCLRFALVGCLHNGEYYITGDTVTVGDVICRCVGSENATPAPMICETP